MVVVGVVRGLLGAVGAQAKLQVAPGSDKEVRLLFIGIQISTSEVDLTVGRKGHRESIKTAQAILGHSDLETTLNTYIAIPDSQRRAVERVAGAWFPDVPIPRLANTTRQYHVLPI